MTAMYPKHLPGIFILLLILLYPGPDVVHGNSPIRVNDEADTMHTLDIIFGKAVDSRLLQKVENDMAFFSDATMTIIDIQRNWNKWSPEFKETAIGYFLKKPIIEENEQISKVLNLGLGKKVFGHHLLPNWIETENFSIEWGNDLDGPDEGSDSVKILNCSKRLLGLSCTGIPDVIDQWADYFEEAWEKEVIELAYIQPFGAGTYLYDVYIANTQDSISGNSDDQTPTLGFNFWGLTATYCDNENFNPICKDDISSLYSYILVNDYVRDAGTMKVTAAHELFHAIQFRYPTIDNWFSKDNRWWLEATATWMEDVVHDDVNSYYSRIRNWLQTPFLSLKYSGNRYSNHEYGDAIFVFFLTGVFTKDRDIVRNIWENENSGIQAIDDTLHNKYRTDFDTVFKKFVAVNAVADIGASAGGYEEGTQYGRARATRITEYPVPDSVVYGESAPQELGSNYIQFIPPDNQNNGLVIEFDGSDSNNWTAMIVKVKSDGSGFDTEEMGLNPLHKYGCHRLEDFGSLYSEIFLVPAVLIDPSLTGTAPYHYRADINGYCDESTTAYLVQTEIEREVSSEFTHIDDKRCFIATAAFGSPESPYVQVLREFRDKFLMPYAIGQELVARYYEISPSIAEFIEQRPAASFFIRVALFPAILFAFFTTKVPLIAILSFIIIALSFVYIFSLRYKQQN